MQISDADKYELILPKNDTDGGSYMQADYHMHTAFSLDSEAGPESMIKGAIEKGLKRICITDHEDHGYVYEGEEFTFNVDDYFKVFNNLREIYRGRIDIYIGVEIGLQPDLGPYYQKYIKRYPFDFVIGSVHLIGQKDPYEPEFFDGRSDEDAYRETFVETLEDIKNYQDFDVLGHLDYVVRYGRHQAEAYSYQKFSDEIDAVLKYLIEHGQRSGTEYCRIKIWTSVCASSSGCFKEISGAGWRNHHYRIGCT